MPLLSKFQGNINVIMCMYFLTHYPTAIPITDKTVVHTYLQNVYATFDGSLILITGNNKEIRNDLFKNLPLN